MHRIAISRPACVTRNLSVRRLLSGVDEPAAIVTKRVTRLQNERGQIVHLLGTAHVSKRSEKETRDLILTTKPKAVFVEVCEQRKHVLEDEGSEKGQRPDMTVSETISAIRSGQLNLFTFFYKMLMRSHDLQPGGEFRAASLAANELGVPLVLGDRLVGITMMRFWQGLTLWDKLKLFSTLLKSSDGGGKAAAPVANVTHTEQAHKPFSEENINALLDQEDLIASSMRDLEKDCPWMVVCLIHERDQYMVLELERTLDELQSGDVVAVVGAGHVPGMKRFWDYRQARIKIEGSIPEEESQKLHHDLQLFPGMELPSGGVYTKKMLREHVASAVGKR